MSLLQRPYAAAPWSPYRDPLFQDVKGPYIADSSVAGRCPVPWVPRSAALVTVVCEIHSLRRASLSSVADTRCKQPADVGESSHSQSYSE